MSFSANNTGGEYKHTLAIDEFPAHSHVLNWKYTIAHSASGTSVQYIPSQVRIEKNDSITTTTVGGGNGHNIIQPYIVVYYWRRTA